MKACWVVVVSTGVLVLSGCGDDKGGSSIQQSTPSIVKTTSNALVVSGSKQIKANQSTYKPSTTTNTTTTNTINNTTGKNPSNQHTITTTNNQTSQSAITGNQSVGANNTIFGSQTHTSKLLNYFDVLPMVDNCSVGRLKDSQKQQAVDVLNEIRALHGLQPVVYDYTHDNEVMESAMMIVANKKMTHYFDSGVKCFTQAGDKGSQTSNLSYYSGGLPPSPESRMIRWLTDENNVKMDPEYRIGHRCWLLNPFLQKISYGMVADSEYGFSAAAVKVIYSDNYHSDSKAKQDYVAYPVGNYPSKYFSKNVPLSFSVISSPNDFWANKAVDYSSAKILVRSSQGNYLNVYDIAKNNNGMGIPNSLDFRVHNLNYNQVYYVTISQVYVNGKPKDYSYWFNVQ